MTPADLARLRSPLSSWRPDMRCADCLGAPTCPQLSDEVWDAVWGMTSAKAPRRCNCAEWDAAGSRSPKGRRVSAGVGEGHWEMCDLVRPRRQLLCLECVEARVGRGLTLLDLKPCMGNYHAFVAVRRLAERVIDRMAHLPITARCDRDDLMADLCDLPRGRSIDQLIADSSVGRGLARMAVAGVEREARQHETCPRGGKRQGRHLWNRIPDDDPAWEEVRRFGYLEHCSCGASR